MFISSRLFGGQALLFPASSAGGGGQVYLIESEDSQSLNDPQAVQVLKNLPVQGLRPFRVE